MPSLAKGLAAAGIASIRFDFDGHGKSEGRMQDMTVEKEIADARAVWEYARSLPYVSSIGLLGHSQGGVIASMTAERLADAGVAPEALVLIAPGSVIKDACRGGKFFNARFAPQDPPEFNGEHAFFVGAPVPVAGPDPLLHDDGCQPGRFQEETVVTESG